MKEKAIQHQSLKEYGFVMKSIYEVCETVTDYVAAGSFADLKKNVEYLSEPNYAQLIRTVDLKSRFLKGNFIYVSKKAFDYLWRVNLNCESIILPNIGNCGEVYYVVPEKLPYKNNVLATNAILVRSLKESNKYLFYIFQSKHFQDELKRITSPVGQTKFNKTELKNICIPIPSRKVQEEIVKILDSFTNLIDALNEELSLRQKQLEYYREKLLTFEECECEWKKLGDILDYEQPSKYIVSSSEYDDNYDIPVLTAGQSFILGYTDEKEGVYKASKNNPTIIFDDFTTGHHWVDFDFKIKSSAMKMLRLKNNKSLLRYIFYSMALINYVPTEHSRQWISKYSQFEIPLPDIKDQECIVNSLDNFTNLISSLKEEIALRQKQYEYYREKLLTFD